MALRRPCPTPDCPELIPRGEHCPRCYDHVKAKAYKREHRDLRAKWTPIVTRGKTPCRRCRKTITQGQPWDVGMPDEHCDYPAAPEHTACNRATETH